MPDPLTSYEELAIAYCAPRGIPLSVFCDVWSERDQWAALKWEADRTSRCPDCGLDTRETFGPEHVDKWNAEIAGHCDGCRARERLQSVMTGNDELDENAGVRLRFWRDQEESDGRVDQPSPAGSET